MIALNLLSPARKDAIRTRILYAVIERLMIMLVIAALITSAALLGVKIRLTQNLSSALSRQILSKEYVSANNETKQVNDLINRLDRLQQQIAAPSRLVEEIAKRTPVSIRIGGFDYDVKSKTLRLRGGADTRDALLSYGESLRASPFIDSVDLPLSNLFQKTNLSFQINVIIKAKALVLTPDSSP